MGLSCGHPTATANLRPGEVVVDLGCGGGLDVFLAAAKVGPTGKAIGIDMTPEMLKPGGRLAVSDIALKRPLPAEIGQDVMAYVGCIAGAVLIEEYRRQLAEAGFAAVQVIDTRADLNAYAKV